MGTCGLVIVRCSGRYFVYAESCGYPEGLGRELVNQIPANPRRYKEWLQNQRAIYAQMIADLESKVLTVTEETLRMYGSDKEEFVTWQMIDDRLEMLPSALCGMWSNYPTSWTYTLDLDREIFSVDMWIHFSMREIPHDRWTTGFTNESYDTRPKVFSFKVCPEGTGKGPRIEYFAGDSSRDEYVAKHRRYDCSIAKARSKIEYLSNAVHRQIIAVVLFKRFRYEHCILFEEYVPGWSHDSFAFRELAFAILSFATGQCRFDRPGHLHGEASNGYLIAPSGDASSHKPKLLPLFASGCHSPGEEAGSAPLSSIYWFENVLVSLVPDIAVQENAEAVIAKVVEFGLEEGKRAFYAVVFSLVNVIMLEVSVENGITVIKHTETTELSPPVEDRDKSADPLEAYCQRQAGFVSLMHFFNAAASRHLSGFSQGCFPTEIYATILANTDFFTYNTCAKVSKTLRALCLQEMPFSYDLRITKFSAERYAKEHEWKFTFQDRNTGSITELGLSRTGVREDWTWCPVIGVVRSSIMTEVRLVFEIGNGRIPPKPERAQLSCGFNIPNRHSSGDTWDIPRNAIVNEVEELWGCYLSAFFRDTHGRSFPNWSVYPARYLCTLMPHYRELSVRSPSDRILWACVRRLVDGDNPQKRADTLTYVTARLSGKANKDDPVIVAFGMDVGLYYWEAKSPSGKRSLRLRVHYDYSREDSRTKFETETLAPLKREWEEEERPTKRLRT